MLFEIVLRIPRIGIVSPAAGPVETGREEVLAATAGCVAAVSTSAFVIRPPGPVPTTFARSIPRSLARRFATGEALIRWGGTEATATPDSGTLISTMRPPGPVPRIDSRATPRVLASLRAAGEARMRLPRPRVAMSAVAPLGEAALALELDGEGAEAGTPSLAG